MRHLKSRQGRTRHALALRRFAQTAQQAATGMFRYALLMQKSNLKALFFFLYALRKT
ncbi:hypothetical protein [Prevotella heparinolytica]|uniref:hypothetical protein n=1 Tax=Prevotella heparinolytica TaxID=28113 RepID=UPI0013ECC841|nr:hypothetical protein [Bacteroides heparinolyticus]